MKRIFAQYKALFIAGGNTVVNVLVIIFNLISVPIYLHFLGVESYGLIGFYATLLATTSLLNFNIGAVMSREIPRMKTLQMREGNINTVIHTLEVLFWILGIGVGLVIGLFAYPLSSWMNADTLPKWLIQQCIWLMGGVLALNWPLQMYAGVFNGLNRQLDASGFYLVYSFTRIFGVVPFFYIFKIGVIEYFIYQFVVSVIFMIIQRIWVWKCLIVKGEVFGYNLAAVKEVAGFLGQMSVVGILTVVVSQLDKLFVSKMLLLSDLTYYTIAASICSGIIIIGSTFNTYLLPKFTKYYFEKDLVNLQNNLYHYVSISTFIILPISVFLFLYSYEFLLVWTQNSLVTKETEIVLKYLLISTTLLSLMNIPITVFTATGHTKFIVLQNVIMILIGIPLLYFFIKKYQLLGAAYFGIIINSIYFIIGYWYLFCRMNLGTVTKIIKLFTVALFKISFVVLIIDLIQKTYLNKISPLMLLIITGVLFFILYGVFQITQIPTLVKVLREKN
ncbi:MAG: oligosaccharide flippase family protein [Bacteroidetes Order II. Incertae sedis bacterium]|nr:oligosaccharide flippase family protein [Bacteroidetes Order II. bacterium]